MSQRYSITKLEAKAILAPYAQLFYNEIINGFNDYLKFDGERSYIHDRTTKSNLVRSYILDRIKRLVLYNPALALKVQKRMFAILIEGKILVRFKKLDKRYRSRNAKSNQSKAFRNRTLKFHGTEALPVDAGWRVNTLYSGIDDVHFVCPDGKQNLWRIPLYNESTNVIHNPLLTPDEKEIIVVATVKPELDNDDNREIAG